MTDSTMPDEIWATTEQLDGYQVEWFPFEVAGAQKYIRAALSAKGVETVTIEKIRNALQDHPDPHPWYGECDRQMPDGGCAECDKYRPAVATDEIFPALTIETAEGEIKKYWTYQEIDGLRIEKGSKIIQAYCVPPNAGLLKEKS